MTENKMTHDEAWTAFRKGELEKLSFIPDIKVLHKKFSRRIKRSCCSEKRGIQRRFYNRIGARLDPKE